MDGDVESCPPEEEADEVIRPASRAEGPAARTVPDESEPQDEEAIREEAEYTLDEYSDLELKVRAEVYLNELKSRKEGREDHGVGDSAVGMVRIKGGRLRKARGTAEVTGKERRKRTLAAEKQVLKLMRRMTDQYGCSAWVLGYTTDRGQLRAACAESMTSWWKEQKVYATQATKAHLNGRGELQQELEQLEKLSFSNLLLQFNRKQLSALTASWIRRTTPSSKRFPLDRSKGSPPWWPESIAYIKTDSLKSKDLLLVAGAAAQSVCVDFPVEAAVSKLEQVLNTSERFTSETARVRALVHLVVKVAVKDWPYQAPEGGEAGGNHSNGQPKEGSAAVEGTHSAAGIGGNPIRRRKCDISQRKYACGHPGCKHLGFTTQSGRASHRIKKHPNHTFSDPPPSNITDEARPDQAEEGQTSNSPLPTGLGFCSAVPCSVADEDGGQRTTHYCCQAPGCNTFMHLPCAVRVTGRACDDGIIFCKDHLPNDSAATEQAPEQGLGGAASKPGPALVRRKPIQKERAPSQASDRVEGQDVRRKRKRGTDQGRRHETQNQAAHNPSPQPEHQGEAAEKLNTFCGPASNSKAAHVPPAAAEESQSLPQSKMTYRARSKRVRRTTWLHARSSVAFKDVPLQAVDENVLATKNQRKRGPREPTFTNLEDLKDYMETVGRAKTVEVGVRGRLKKKVARG